MPIEDAIRMFLTDYWDAIWSDLNSGQREDLSRSLRGLALAGQDETAVGSAVLKLMRVLRHALPEEHPVRRAAGQVSRLATARPVDWEPALPRTLSMRIAEMNRQDVHTG